MKTSTGLLIGLASLLVGCAIELHEPAPQRRPDPWRRPWLVHCETAKLEKPARSPRGKKARARWVWAKDEAGQKIQLSGELQDGFLVAAPPSFPGDGVPQGASGDPKALRRACQSTIDQTLGYGRYELGQIRAARRGERLEVPIVFAEEDDGGRPISRLVIFGDSLSDSGKLKKRLRVFPGHPYWVGRFSNGPNWVDYLEAVSGLAVQNHAYGGASVQTYSPMENADIISHVMHQGQFFVSGSLGRQVDDYTHRFLDGGILDDPQETVFVLWGGANDYISKEPFTGAIDTLLDSPLAEGGYQSVVHRVMAALGEQVEKLYAIGARRFVIINLPDLGKTPIVLQNRSYRISQPDTTEPQRKLALAERLSALSRFHNQELAELVRELRQRLLGATLLLQDTATSFAAIQSNEAKFGTDIEEIALGFDLKSQGVALPAHDQKSLRIQKPCYVGNYLGSSESGQSCDAAANVVFWDTIHPTSYTHCWQAYFLAIELQQVGWLGPLPEPEEYKVWCTKISHRAQSSNRTD